MQGSPVEANFTINLKVLSKREVMNEWLTVSHKTICWNCLCIWNRQQRIGTLQFISGVMEQLSDLPLYESNADTLPLHGISERNRTQDRDLPKKMWDYADTNDSRHCLGCSHTCLFKLSEFQVRAPLMLPLHSSVLEAVAHTHRFRAASFKRGLFFCCCSEVITAQIANQSRNRSYWLVFTWFLNIVFSQQWYNVIQLHSNSFVLFFLTILKKFIQ